jgi:hypothetical protein
MSSTPRTARRTLAELFDGRSQLLGLSDQQVMLSVKPLPDESCFVRYGAAVLLLVAIATLVLLVFLGR